MVQGLLDALRRYLQLFVRQDQEWNLVVAQKPALAEVVFPFSVIGLLVSLIASVIGMLLRAGETSIVLEMVLQLAVDAGSVAAFAAVTGVASRRFDSVRPAMGEIAALYSACGLWLAGVPGFVPVPLMGWLWLLMGVVFTGYLLNGALVTVVGVPDHQRLKFLALSLGVLVAAETALRLTRHVILGAMGIY